MNTFLRALVKYNFLQWVHFYLPLRSEENKVVNSIKKQLRISQCSSTIFIHPVTKDELICVTEGLKDKLSAGFDDIPVSLIKKCITSVKKPLVHIYNISLNSGVFPNEWKIAKVIPLYKKGDRSDYKNYRPMSVLPVFSKILERVMFNRLIYFVIKNRILTETQNGFRKGKCIETAIQSFMERIQEALDKR